LVGATDCGPEGARACKKGWYLATGKTGQQTCESCRVLDHCVECSNQDTCTRCSSRGNFKISKDGKCERYCETNLKKGLKAYWDDKEALCIEKCPKPEKDEPVFHRTTQGCITCDEAIPGCTKCKEITEGKTQI